MAFQQADGGSVHLLWLIPLAACAPAPELPEQDADLDAEALASRWMSGQSVKRLRASQADCRWRTVGSDGRSEAHRIWRDANGAPELWITSDGAARKVVTWTRTTDGDAVASAAIRGWERRDGYLSAIRFDERYEEGRVVARESDQSALDTWTYDEHGRLLSADVGMTRDTWTYTADGRVASHTNENDDSPGTGRDRWWWDGARLIESSSSYMDSGDTLTWTVHDGDLPLEGEGYGGHSAGEWSWTESWTWNEAGRPLRHERVGPHSVVTEGWVWDDDHLVAVGFIDASGALSPTMTWEWDESGRLVATSRGESRYTWEYGGDQVVRVAYESPYGGYETALEGDCAGLGGPRGWRIWGSVPMGPWAEPPDAPAPWQPAYPL